MPWNDQKGGWQQGGGGGGRGPWGQGPGGGNRGGGGGGVQPPNLEDLMKRGRDQLKGWFPNHSPSLIIVALVVGTLLLLWMLTGFYSIQPAEQGIVLRFGQVVDTLGPGFHIRFPQPIEIVLRPDIQAENQINIGFRTADDSEASSSSDLSHESMMLTGDENIIDVDFAVFWRIQNAQDYLFRVTDVDSIIKAVAESAMREAVGQNKIDDIQMSSRAKIQDQVRNTTQQVLDSYKAGVTITRVTLQTAQAPQAVIDAFRDVQAATSDQLRRVNEAQRYQNEIVPQAKGAAAKIIQDAEAYKQQAVTLAQGEAQRFTTILEQYKVAPQVTRERMYIETMQRILSGANKVLVPNSGVLPYLPLPGLAPRVNATQQQQQPQVTTGGNQ